LSIKQADAQMKGIAQKSRGFTYVEILLALAIAALLMAGLGGVVGQALQIRDDAHERNELSSQAGFAMQRMARAISHTRRLLLPLNDNPNTNWPEHIREQTIPQSAPVGDSTKATAVLALTLSVDVDLDANGIPDADNDGDGLIDEDLPADNNFDGAPGIALIDDNGDGSIDDSSAGNPFVDNDEDDASGDETINGMDDDGDGSVDEDITPDMNGDGQRGVAGVDDNGDGVIDQGDAKDDDEDGRLDEDWYDALVFHLEGDTLKERMPVPWDTNGDSLVTGSDFVVSAIAEHVTRFRVERVQQSTLRWQLIDLTLELTSPISGEVISLRTQVRLGGAL
jgi:type II secretory pathway pseudopilin PulG